MENHVSRPTQPFFGYTSRPIFAERSRKLFIDWFSGLIGGFASATICAPMDLARTRHMLVATTKSHGKVAYQGVFQTIGRIVQDEGIRGLYKGYNITAVSIPMFHSLYFMIFQKSKESFKAFDALKDHELTRNIVASLYTGFICTTVTNPLWVIRTRFQSEFLHNGTRPRYTGLFNGVNRLVKEEGPKALFKGLGASYFGLTHAIILYPLYEHLKSKITAYKGTPSSLDIFLASLASKFTALVMTYPHLVIRTRLQDNRSPSSIKEKATIASVIRNTYRREGFRGFYSGLRIDLVRVLPANSVMFVTFEFLKKAMEKRFIEEESYC